MNVPLTAIETVSGRLVDLADPKPEDFEASDIAWALSREPRFGGHTITSEAYTVGQHSLRVAELILFALTEKHSLHKTVIAYFAKDDMMLKWIDNMTDMDTRRWVVKLGLLHDASEAYLRDLPSPVKNLPGLKEAYIAVENKVMDQILIKFELPQHSESLHFAWRLVHWADIYARTVEAYHFMPSRGAHWASNQKVSLVDIQEFQLPRPQMEVYHEFLAKLQELSR
jgi:uncharacterized protein